MVVRNDDGGNGGGVMEDGGEGGLGVMVMSVTVDSLMPAAGLAPRPRSSHLESRTRIPPLDLAPEASHLQEVGVGWVKGGVLR